MSRPVEALLYFMPTVASKAENDWARGFALSVMRQARRRNWNPSPKQLGIMNRLVSDLFTETDDFTVIEDVD